MKKVVKATLNNCTYTRGIRDLNVQLYSHDRNNAGFEFTIKNEIDLSEYRATVLFDFQDTFAALETKGTIEGNVVKVKFDTDLITKCEEVIGYLMLDSDTNSLDVFKFKFNVVLSQIDRPDLGKRGFRYIKDQEVVDVITRSELEEEIKKLQVNGGIDLSNYLTTSAAEATYVKKTDLPTPYNDSALVQKIGQLEARVDKDTVYDDTPLKERVTALESKALEGGAYDDTHLRERLDTLEAKQDKDTVYDDTNIKERLTNLENKPSVDTSNFVTNTTLEEKHYVTNEQISSTYATKSEIPQPYSDIELVKRITVLENRQDNDTVYDDAELKRRVTALEERPNVDTSDFVTTAVLESKGYLTTHQDISNFALKSEIPQPYNDSALVSRVQALETKQDNDTVYDDTKVKERLTALESKPNINTSDFVTNEALNSKGYLTTHQDLGGYVKKSELGTLHPTQTLSLNNNTLSISNGNSVVLPTNQYEIHGTGMPNGVVEAEIGTTYVDKNKTNGALKWIKTTDGGNTGWRVFTGDTGWRTLPLRNNRDTAKLQVRRINDEIIVKFDGLQWGWFGVADLTSNNQDGNIVDKTIAGKQYTWIKLNVGRGNEVLPEGFRSASSLLSGLYGDLGDLLGSVYVGGTEDSNAVQLRYAMSRNELTNDILSQIRICPITFVTDDGWPVQLP